MDTKGSKASWKRIKKNFIGWSLDDFLVVKIRVHFNHNGKYAPHLEGVFAITTKFRSSKTISPVEKALSIWIFLKIADLFGQKSFSTKII